MDSRRDDRRGHWPAGKRRHSASNLGRARQALKHARLHYSLREISRQTKISDRTLRRWLAGKDYPSDQHVARLQRFR